MKAVIKSPIARVDFSWLVGSSDNAQTVKAAKKFSRKRERAQLKAFFHKEAQLEVHADIADRIEADRVEREIAYREMMVRMMNRRRDKQMAQRARREAARQAEINARYGWQDVPEVVDYGPRTDSRLMVGNELRLVASCG